MVKLAFLGSAVNEVECSKVNYKQLRYCEVKKGELLDLHKLVLPLAF